MSLLNCDCGACCEPVVDVERECAEISQRAHTAKPSPDGRLAEQWHQFLDIDPDLRGRDYTRTERTRGGAS